MKKPIVFADLQGTICFDSWSYGQKIIETVEFLHENNGIFIINTTAPSNLTIKRIASELNADVIISQDGEVIEDLRSGLTYKDYLSSYQLSLLFKSLEQDKLTIKIKEHGRVRRLVVTKDELVDRSLFLEGIEGIEILNLREDVVVEKLIELRKFGLICYYNHSKGELKIRLVTDKGTALR